MYDLVCLLKPVVTWVLCHVQRDRIMLMVCCLLFGRHTSSLLPRRNGTIVVGTDRSTDREVPWGPSSGEICDDGWHQGPHWKRRRRWKLKRGEPRNMPLNERPHQRPEDYGREHFVVDNG